MYIEETTVNTPFSVTAIYKGNSIALCDLGSLFRELPLSLSLNIPLLGWSRLEPGFSLKAGFVKE